MDLPYVRRNPYQDDPIWSGTYLSVADSVDRTRHCHLQCKELFEKEDSSIAETTEVIGKITDNANIFG